MPLRGIVLGQGLTDFAPGGVAGEGLQLAASPVVAADARFREYAAARLGQPISIPLLQELITEIVLAYRRAGRPLADTAVPEQNIGNGTVQVIILEAHLVSVEIEGARYHSAEHIQAAPDGRVAQTRLPAFNDMFDSATARYVVVATERNWLPIVCFAGSILFAIYTTFDLKYPRRGVIRVGTCDQLLVDQRTGLK